jgi:hypothetical protein
MRVVVPAPFLSVFAALGRFITYFDFGYRHPPRQWRMMANLHSATGQLEGTAACVLDSTEYVEHRLRRRW